MSFHAIEENDLGFEIISPNMYQENTGDPAMRIRGGDSNLFIYIYILQTGRQQPSGLAIFMEFWGRPGAVFVFRFGSC